MKKDDQTTAVQLYKILLNQGHQICLATLLNSKKISGWTFRVLAYCQLIRPANKIKRLKWAKENTDLQVDNVIWTDKASIQMESYRRFCHRKKKQSTPKSCQSQKHP